MQPRDIKLVQTGPGTYEAEFATNEPGNYVLVMNYRGQKGEQGVLLSGVAMNSSPELRELKSNDATLLDIANRTGGRVLPAFDPVSANLFDRTNLPLSASPLPIWDILLPVLLGLIILDVAIRRIAWDWLSTKRMALAVANGVRAWTLSNKVESRQTLDALKRVREETTKQADAAATPARPAPPTEAAPNPKAKFEAKGVEGDITKVVGGATDKPIPPAPKKVEPKGAPAQGDRMGGLLEAKRRAQQQIRDKEQGGGQ
jgi:hypothetical protein